mmetsp:Transcript_12945/g.23808  ORF Transcript_12945/g.23808 Transcript_12945/m.23808 type:complete len:340 (+) Transcript_12945:68-1087(+)
MALTFVAGSSSAAAAGSTAPLLNAGRQVMPLAAAAPEPCTYAATMASGTIAGIAAAALRRSAGGRRTSAVSRAAVAVSVGQKVTWKGMSGTVQYSGKVEFASGDWVGVELDAPNGLHDGSVFGKQYFQCTPKHGIFCQPADVGAGGAAAPAPVAQAAAPVASPVAAPSGGVVAVGQKVTWKGQSGTVQYVGKVKFASGEWVGIQLDQPSGMHDGTVFGVPYFSCPPKTGVFCTADELGGAGAGPAAVAGPSTPAPAAAAAPAAAPTPAGHFSVGQRVNWCGTGGTVQYVGKVGFASGPWVGVALDEPKGVHDGTLFNTTYFTCPPRHGVFAQGSSLQIA